MTPKPDYSQFVRFKDGLEGLVRLREEQLSGVLAALKDRQFFERVFIDQGAALGRVTSIWLQTPCTPKFRATEGSRSLNPLAVATAPFHS